MAYGKYANIQKERVVELKGLKLYIERLELSLGEDIVVITKNEAHILELLMERHPRVSGREDLLEALWDDQSFVDENTLNRSEEHTSELQSRGHLVCRLLLEKKKKIVDDVG